MTSSRQKRLIFGLIAAPLALAGVFFLPPLVIFGLVAILLTATTAEFVRIVRFWAPTAPLGWLLVLVPVAGSLLYAAFRLYADATRVSFWLVVAAQGVVLAAALIGLAPRTRIEEAGLAIGLAAFAVPYFAVPLACLGTLQWIDPWLVTALLAIVWLSDTMAFFVGSKLGRHKMSPRVSPNKSWEGAAGGFLAAMIAAAIWSWWRLDRIDLGLMGVAAVTAVTAQVGDLVESLFKRGAGVKDSSQLIPGHGGLYDRLDALLLAAPVFLAGLWLIGANQWTS